MLLVSTAAFLFLVQLPVGETAPEERLTIETLGRDLGVVASAPAVRWARDGQHLRVGSGEDEVWYEPRTWQIVPATASNAQTKPSNDNVPPALTEVAAIANASVRGLNGVWELNVQAVDGSSEVVHRSGTELRVAQVSDDAAFVSWVENGDLRVLALGKGKPTLVEVTKDGDPDLLDGVLDWVYQEELYGRGDFRGHWWSPSEPLLAYLTLEEHRVRNFPIIDHVPIATLDRERGVELEFMRYPKAGDANPGVLLSVFDARTARSLPVEIPGMPRDGLIVRVEWTPDGKTLLVCVQDRIQTWAELHGVDPSTGQSRLWIREDSESWVNRPNSPRWLADGSFLWQSERTGYNHLYHYRAGGEVLGIVTQGEWQVRDIEHVEEATGQIVFEGTRDGAIDRNWYRVPLSGMGPDGTALVRLTTGPGTHRLSWSADRSLFLDRVSSLESPARTLLCDARDGAVLREVAADRLEPEVAFAPTRLLEVPARDGYPLDVSVILPLDFERAQERRWPIYLDTYSGPDAPTIRNAFGVSSWDQFLAQEGLIVLRCNVRSASGRGQAHTAACYLQLGVQELRDLEDAVDFTVQELRGDPARVGISGWSYGGFMAAFALTHSKRFALGLAGGGVHDWRLYDTIYTERYMSTPQLNPKGYAETSVIGAANELFGHLAILHGTMDDNVHMQNSIQLLAALQEAGKTEVSLMLFPNSRHGVSGSLRQAFQWQRIREVLLAP